MFTWGSLCSIHYLKVVFNVTEAECASGITSLKFIFSYIEQKIEPIQTLKKKKKSCTGVADTWQVCYIITLPSGQNTVTPVNNIFCFMQYLNRLCSRAPKPVTCLTSQKQENQTDKVQIIASSSSPPRVSDSL